jgi:hypothetical protein
MCSLYRADYTDMFASLDRFLQRIARHPTLARASLTQAFLESTEWVSQSRSAFVG